MDIDIIRFLQQASPLLDGPMRALSLLGTEDFFQLLIPLVLWCVRPSTGLRVLLLLAASNYLNALLKWAFQLPRPYWVNSGVRALSSEISYGMPSGHAQLAVTLWGLVAYSARKAWAWAAAGALIAGIAISRVYLGVHYLLDVLAGVLVGAAALALWIGFEPRCAAWLRGRRTSALIGLALAASIVLLIGAVIARAVLAPGAHPQAWSALALAASGVAIEPRSLDSLAVSAAAIAGGGAGYAIMRATSDYNPAGTLLQMIARVLLGFAVLAALRFGLGAVLPREPEAVGLAFRYVRYVALVAWAVWGAPWVFMKLGLAKATKN